MGFDQFLQAVSCELQEILWKDVPRHPAGEEFRRREEALDLASAKLTKLRAEVDELRSRLAEKERQLHQLQARVEVYLHVADRTNAWRHALELDQLRKTLDQQRARLRRRQQVYDAQRARVRHLQEQLEKYPFEM
jgi:chromosome segregation ATPase